jgi:hypothetical protein
MMTDPVTAVAAPVAAMPAPVAAMPAEMTTAEVSAAKMTAPVTAAMESESFGRQGQPGDQRRGKRKFTQHFRNSPNNFRPLPRKTRSELSPIFGADRANQTAASWV